MKKYMLVCAGLAVALAFTSCKSSESAYRKAYDKAKAQEEANMANNNYEETPVVAPVQTRPSTAGYPAQVAFNSSNNMYRVVATTFDDKASAVRSRNDFRAGEYADAWLLFNQQ